MSRLMDVVQQAIDGAQQAESAALKVRDILQGNPEEIAKVEGMLSALAEHHAEGVADGRRWAAEALRDVMSHSTMVDYLVVNRWADDIEAGKQPR